MLVKLLTFSFLSLNLLAENIKINDKFLVALRKTETIGAPNNGINARGRHGELGPYQIRINYWRDAIGYDKTIGGSFSNCGQKEYSEKVITAYLNRYCKKAILASDYETMARTHNNGPKINKSSVSYWNRFKKFFC